MSRQTLLFLSTVGVGAVIGVLYDLFRVLRKTAAHNNAVVQMEDLIFWLAATLLMFYFMLVKNYGEIRFFAVLGVAVGMALYFCTVSRWLVGALVALTDYIKRVVAAVIRLVLWPVNRAAQFLLPPLKKLKRFCVKRLHTLRLYGKMKYKKYARDWLILRKKV
jgi:spore cortex biosynthesis protein YabQ